MTMVNEQHAFLLDVAKLLQKAEELGFVMSGGELFRTPDQQAIYLKTGRSKTMASKHLQRLAIDLNFFIKKADGSVALTYDIPTLKPLGDFWEQLSKGKNSWGGNWNSFKDVPHFERRTT
jgi:hypothetical protein